MAKQDKLYPVLISRLPEFISDEYPKFLEFLTEYFKWLETEHDDGTVNFTRALLDFDNNKDIASRSDAYIDSILRSLGFSVDRDMKMGKHFLAMFVKNFYMSRGSEKSFRFLFKLFFNKDVRIDYPRKLVAKSSSAEYSSRTILMTTGENHNAPSYKAIVENEKAHFSTVITGIVSGVQAAVEKIVDYTINGKRYLEFTIIKPEKRFIPGEAIHIEYDNYKFIETNVKCGLIRVTTPGHYYHTNDTIKVDIAGQVQQGSYRVKRIQSGKIESVTVVAGGTGYSVGDRVYPVNSQSGAGFYAEVSTIDASGAITSVRVDNAGWRYDNLPTLIIDSAGTGASLIPVSTSIGGVAEIESIVPVLYETYHTPTMSFTGNGEGIAVEFVESSTFDTPSKFLDPVNGILGRKCIITDSRLYQQYSYEVISDESPESYRDLMDMVHPVGYQRFNVMSMLSATEKLTLSNKLMWKVRVKIAPYRKADFAVTHIRLTNSERFMLVKVIRSLGLKKVNSLSINTLDPFKFSDNFDYLPLEITVPVIDSVMSNRFMNEALEAEINLIPV